MRCYRRQPTRLHHPWDSPGKNTGVGSNLLLQCMKVKSESEVIQSCPTLRDPMDCSLPGSLAHGIFQARVLEWVVIAFSECMFYKRASSVFQQSNKPRSPWRRGKSTLGSMKTRGDRGGDAGENTCKYWVPKFTLKVLSLDPGRGWTAVVWNVVSPVVAHNPLQTHAVPSPPMRGEPK